MGVYNDIHGSPTQCRTIDECMIVDFFHSLYPGNDGHIYYLGDACSVSIMSVIDASECPPTYGAGGSHLLHIKGGLLIVVLLQRFFSTANNFDCQLIKFSTSIVYIP